MHKIRLLAWLLALPRFKVKVQERRRVEEKICPAIAKIRLPFKRNFLIASIKFDLEHNFLDLHFTVRVIGRIGTGGTNEMTFCNSHK